MIFYPRNTQYIFLAQRVWWISSIIGLQKELVIHIENLNRWRNIRNPIAPVGSPEHSGFPDVHPDRVGRIHISSSDHTASEHESISTTETDMYNKVIDNCEEFLQQSKQARKAVGRSLRQASRVLKWTANKRNPIKTFGTQTEGIDGNELRRWKAARECQRCVWPQDRKGSYKTIDCFRWKKLETGTAPFPKKKKPYKQD